MATKASKSTKTPKKSNTWIKIKNGISILLLIFAILFFFNSDIMLAILVILMGMTFNPFTYKRIEKLIKKDFKLFHKILTFAASFILFFVILVATTHSLQEQTNKDMAILYDEIVERSELDQKMEKYAQKESSKFFDYYSESQLQGQIVLNQIYTIIEDLDEQEQYATLGIFSSKVYAKKRRSMMYYIPIFGSLVKAKHQSLETARANIYHAIKDPKNPQLNSILSFYGIKDVEELRTLDDLALERIVRDEELRSYVDFTKITQDLGKTAVSTVVEASQAVVGGKIINPIADTKDAFIEDLKDGKLDTVGEDLKSKNKGILRVKQDFQKTTKTVLGVKKEVIAKIPPTILEKKRHEIGVGEQVALMQKLIEEKNQEPFIIVHKTKLPDLALKLDAGDWEISSSDENNGLLDLGDIQIDAGMVTEAEIGQFDLTIENNISLQAFISDYKTKPLEIKPTEIKQEVTPKIVQEEAIEDIQEEIQELEEEEYIPEFEDNSYQEGYTYIYGVESTTERIIYYDECSPCFSYGLVCHAGSAGSYCCGMDDGNHHGQCDIVSEIDYRGNESEDANNYGTIFDTDRVKGTDAGDAYTSEEDFWNSVREDCGDGVCIIGQEDFDARK